MFTGILSISVRLKMAENVRKVCAQATNVHPCSRRFTVQFAGILRPIAVRTRQDAPWCFPLIDAKRQPKRAQRQTVKPGERLCESGQNGRLARIRPALDAPRPSVRSLSPFGVQSPAVAGLLTRAGCSDRSLAFGLVFR